MKYELEFFSPVILTTINAPIIIKNIPKKYINVPTHAASLKNTPANKAITGRFGQF